MTFHLNDAQADAFQRDGCLIVKALFDAEKTALLRRAMEEDPAVRDHVLVRADAHGGGAWEWHQDKGYWYYNGCLYPHMVSCMIGLDRADRENGCLQFLKGPHHLGRADHVKLTNEQNGIDPKVIAAAEDRLELVHAELDPGDAVFFHCNMFHRSDQNLSDKQRWTLIICYNRVDNDTYTRDDDRYFVPLDKVDDGVVKAAGLRFADGSNAEHFTETPYVPDVARRA